MVCPLNPSGIVGGAERLWEGLVAALIERGHDAHVVGLPSYEWTLPDLVRTYAAFDALELDDYDMVVSGKYPAWMVRHRRHVVHMCHTLRGLYDTYPAQMGTMATGHSGEATRLLRAIRARRPGSDQARGLVLEAAMTMVETLPDGHPDLAFPGPLARELVHFLDADGLDPSRISGYFAISRTVANRDGYFPPAVDVQVAVPPSGLPGLRHGPFESIFTASRLDGPKRLDLLVDAMAFVPTSCTLRIAGTGPLAASLKQRAAADDRIVFLDRISDDELADEYSKALVVPFIPHDEDLGLITLEAQMSGKPVITCTDSGGATDLVRDGVTGLVVAPDPIAIGAALSTFLHRPEVAAEMGAAGEADARMVTWDRLVTTLLATPRGGRHHPRRRRQRLVALSTYVAEPALHGGQVRINRLYTSLAREFDVELLALTSDPNVESGQVAPGFRQTVVRPSEQHHHLEGRFAPQARVPIGDVVACLAAPFDTVMQSVVEMSLDAAAGILLPQPYLFPHIRKVSTGLPLIYDSQNSETDLKAAAYQSDAFGRALAGAVREVEQATLAHADLVVAVSEEDASALRLVAPTMADVAVVANGADVLTTDFVTDEERLARRRAYLGSLRSSGWDHELNEVALFIGSGHPPNVDAATSIMLAARALPDVLFVLVGSHVGGLSGPPIGPNVMARGPVTKDELQFLLSLCTVGLNPMRSGSGTNIKMVDYFAAGAPVVSTAVGARGLGVRDGVDVLLADQSELDWAIQRVIDDRPAADRRAARARSVALPFDWAGLGEAFTGHIVSLLAAQLAPGRIHPFTA